MGAVLILAVAGWVLWVIWLTADPLDDPKVKKIIDDRLAQHAGLDEKLGLEGTSSQEANRILKKELVLITEERDNLKKQLSGDSDRSTESSSSCWTYAGYAGGALAFLCSGYVLANYWPWGSKACPDVTPLNSKITSLRTSLDKCRAAKKCSKIEQPTCPDIGEITKPLDDKIAALTQEKNNLKSNRDAYKLGVNTIAKKVCKSGDNQACLNLIKDEAQVFDQMLSDFDQKCKRTAEECAQGKEQLTALQSANENALSMVQLAVDNA